MGHICQYGKASERNPVSILFYTDITGFDMMGFAIALPILRIISDPLVLECYEKPGLWEADVSLARHLRETRFLCFCMVRHLRETGFLGFMGSGRRSPDKNFITTSTALPLI